MGLKSATRLGRKDELDPADASSQPSDGVELAGGLSPARFWLLSIGVCLGLFLSIIDSSIVATSLFTIGTELGDLNSVNWIALSYTLAYLGCAVAFARISDVIGRRNAFLAAYVLFFSFSLASGFAQDLRQLIAFRTIQGLGGSGLYSLTMIILPEVCPAKLIKFVGAMIGMVIAWSGVLGPVLGGILTEYSTWRWVFWINGPIGIVSLAIFLLSWPKPEDMPYVRVRSWKSFDYFGTLLIIAAAVLVVYAFQNAGESFYEVWNTAIFIAPLAAGVVCWTGVVIWSYMLDKGIFGKGFAPAFPLRLFRNRHYSAAALSTLFLGYPFLLLIFSFPMRAQVVSGKSALVSGLMLLPMLGTSALASAISGAVNSKRNFLFETMATGASLMVLGCGLLTTVHGPADDSKAMGFLAFTGLGFGLATASATMLVSFEAPLADAAPAHGILAQMRILGGSIGISTSSVLLRNALKDVGGEISSQGLRALNEGASSLSGEQAELVRHAYSKAFRDGMIVSVIIAGLAVLVAPIGFRRTRLTMLDQRAKLIREDEARHATENESESGNDKPL